MHNDMMISKLKRPFVRGVSCADEAKARIRVLLRYG